MHTFSQERIHNFTSINQPIDVQLVEIAEATKAMKGKEGEENRQVGQKIFDAVRHLMKQKSIFRCLTASKEGV